MENNETWKVYHCFDGEYPSELELEHLRGIIIPGNEDDPDDDFEYLTKTQDLIRLIFDKYPNIRMFGSCAGHQLIAMALGGKCQRLPDLKGPMIFGKHYTNVTQEMKDMEEFKTVFGKETDRICVIRSHGWIVSELPEGAVSLGGGDHGDYDFYKIGDRILSSQPHPEFTEKFEEYHELYPMLKQDQNSTYPNALTEAYKDE